MTMNSSRWPPRYSRHRTKFWLIKIYVDGRNWNTKLSEILPIVVSPSVIWKTLTLSVSISVIRSSSHCRKHWRIENTLWFGGQHKMSSGTLASSANVTSSTRSTQKANDTVSSRSMHVCHDLQPWPPRRPVIPWHTLQQNFDTNWLLDCRDYIFHQCHQPTQTNKVTLMLDSIFIEDLFCSPFRQPLMSCMKMMFRGWRT